MTVQRRSPSLIWVELGGAGLDGFASLGAPDEACVFEFPVPAAHRGLVPDPGRWYSLQEVGPRRMGIGIVVHPGGLGSAWAERARVGDTLRITRQKSWFRRPAGAQWQVLVADVTGLPALTRILAETPAAIPTQAIIEIPDPDDERYLPDGHGAHVRWIHNPTLGTTGSRIADLLEELRLPPGEGYVYVAGETTATRAARKILRRRLQLLESNIGVVGYWRRRAHTDHLAPIARP